MAHRRVYGFLRLRTESCKPNDKCTDTNGPTNGAQMVLLMVHRQSYVHKQVKQ